jgi:serine/threonine-protein kinase RsbW
MNNMASRSATPRIRTTPGHAPPADGHAGPPAIAALGAAGPLCSSINLPAIAGEVASARRFVASFVDDSTLADDAVLCVSELAANAVIHSNSRFPDGRFTVAVERYSDGHFRIKVLDQGGRWIKQDREGHDHLGLMIVSRLARAWGIDGDCGDGWTVWFELCPGKIPPPSPA